MQIKIEFKPQDCWIGAFWKRHPEWLGIWRYDLWICVIPMLPIHITWLHDSYKPHLNADCVEQASQDTAPMESDPV